MIMDKKMVLFDLDGTLLPMDNDYFTEKYFVLLCKKLVPYGYEPKKLIASIWQGTKAMVLNDGSKTNEEAFWEEYASIYGKESLKHKPVLEEFYTVDFNQAKEYCGFNPLARKVIDLLKSQGKRIALATNPIFPKKATELRIGWAGLKPDDFEYITAYENSSYCKPNLDYYKDLCKKLGVEPSQCLMVGNDVNEDMIAQDLGMEVFLITDFLINKSNKDISKYNRGNFSDLIDYLSK